MKKKKILKKAIVNLVLIAMVLQIFANKGIVLAADEEYYIRSGGQIVKELLLDSTSPVDVRIGTSTGDLTKLSILKWFNSDENVVSVQYGGEDNFINIVKAIGPGKATLTAQFLDQRPGQNNNLINFADCVVKVPLKIDQESDKFKQYKLTGEKTLLLEKAETYKIVLQNGITYKRDNVKWVIPADANQNVVKVDFDGNITAIGSGTTYVQGIALSDSTITDKIRVTVAPKVKDPVTTNFLDSIVITKDNYEDNRLIETNAKFASNLTWKVYEASDTIDPTKKVETTDLILDPHTYNEFCAIEKAKAGKYDIYAFTASDVIGSTAIPVARIRVEVPVNLKSTDKFLNVGDTYDIFENANIKKIEDFNVAPNDPNGVLRYDSSTGIVTAIRKGDATYVINVKSADNPYGLDPNDKIVINFHVIDGITLNSSVIYLPIKGKTTLIATSTNQYAKMTWKSSNSSVATVDQNGTVTGVAKGVATITVSQTIDGVVKQATCTVHVVPAVEAVVLKPQELTLGIDEYRSIMAEIKPDGVATANLAWVSSNEEVVKIDSADNKTAVVYGVAGGEAIVSAINKENVVLGSCKVTVVQPVEEIKLSDTKIITDLSNKIIKLTAEVKPANATDKSLTWRSTDTKVATVKDGIVTLMSSGTTSIVVTSVSNPKVEAICNITVNVPVTGIQFESTNRVMYTGEKYKLPYKVLPANATNKNVTWTSTNTSVATVDTNGNVTAVASGQSVIIGRTAEGNYIDTCIIYVKQEATGIKFDTKDVIVSKGKTYKINYTLTPNTVTETTLKWESSNTAIATVDSKGTVTAVETGSTIIMARTALGQTAYCNVTVVENVDGVKLNYDKKTVYKGNSFILKAMIMPNGATNKNVSFSSSNTKVATVTQGGTVKGISGGTAIITVTTKEGSYIANCVVTVVELATSVKLNKTSYKLGVKKTLTLKATVKSTNASNKKVKWKSSNTKVATVSSTGKVTAKKLGTCTITATATDGSGASASCSIRVVNPVSSIHLSRSAITLVVGRSTKLKSTIYPKNATYKTANYTSSDSKIAMVSSNGTITGLEPGVAIIKAGAKDNSGKSAICRVRVIEEVPATSITLPLKDITLAKGDVKLLDKSIQPVNHTDKVTWSSENSRVASVDKTTGKLTAKNTGTTTITAMTTSGKTASMQVTVVGLNRTSITIQQYQSYTLYIDQVSSGVKWFVENPEVAGVTNGVVVGYKPGKSTYVYANVRGVMLRCKVTVTKIK